MNYNFDKQEKQRGTWSIKWDQFEDPDVLGMANADMDFKASDCIIRALEETAKRGYFNYHMKPDAYFEAVTGYYKRRFDWEVKREWMLSTPGIWAATRLCIETYTKPGDRIIVQSPRFGPLARIVKNAGRHLVLNPMTLKNGRFEIDFEDFEKKIQEEQPALYFMVNLQNPTGRVFSREEVERLQRICYENHVMVISDEVHANLLFKGVVHTPAPAVSQEAAENTVLLTAASKSWNIVDLTYCIIIAPDTYKREKLLETLNGYSFNFATNAFSIAGTTAAFSPEGEEWNQEAALYIEENVDYLMEYFEKYIPEIRPIRPEGSFLVWLDCREMGMDSQELYDFFLKKSKVGLSVGAAFGPFGFGFERINLGCTKATLETALQRIRKAVEERRGKNIKSL